MVHAYILIQTEVGKAAQVAATISEIEGVSKAEDVTGPYDVIVQMEADDLDKLGNAITDGIQRIEGVQRTTTCLAVRLS